MINIRENSNLLASSQKPKMSEKININMEMNDGQKGDKTQIELNPLGGSILPMPKIDGLSNINMIN